MKSENEKGEKKKPWYTPVRVFLGVLSLGALGYGFWWVTRKNNKPGSEDDLNFEPTADEAAAETQPAATKPASGKTGGGVLKKKSTSDDASGSTAAKKPASDFPLKRGMPKNDKVARIQQMLIAKHPGSLKKADGIYGPATEAALIKYGLPTEISEAQYNVLTAIDPETTAQAIYDAAKKKDFAASMAAMQAIKTPEDYKAVNEKFKPKGLVGGYNTTIVTGMTETFKDQTQKDQMAVAFTTMGLGKKDGKWYIPDTSAVSGIPRKVVMTTQPTKVWKDVKHMVNVGRDTILGYELYSGEGITVFDTVDGYRLNVVTAHVKYN